MKANENTWRKVTAASGKTDTYSLTAQSWNNNYSFKCVVSNGTTTETQVVTLTVTA